MIRFVCVLIAVACIVTGCGTPMKRDTISREEVARMTDEQVLRQWDLDLSDPFREERILEEAVTARGLLTFEEYRQVVAGEVTIGQREEVARLAVARSGARSGSVRVLGAPSARYVYSPTHGRIWFENGRVVAITS